ncbi:hypothetical protein M413DRAFT_440145 [Hebeloma cylindrosporum]|uniref:peptidyl-tRNA hydrolase n=1 Tax=Hebeloma cylindrosporum TaxID=76867 RepID=A0A0C3CW88_HEBCY|nr:hypothetical protein M413DRAFT_440145 [Hebeloma cylindrosporum h7]
MPPYPSPNTFTGQVALGVLLSLASIGLGYQLGLGSFSYSKSSAQQQQQRESDAAAKKELVEEEERREREKELAEVIPDGDLAAVSAGFLEPCKMVLVVRTDLQLTPGDVAAQCAHATLSCYKVLSRRNSTLVNHWERTGQAKIALKAKSEDQLLELEAIAKSLNLCARSVTVDPGTGDSVRAVLGIGPGPVGLINEVTGKLRLL